MAEVVSKRSSLAQLEVLRQQVTDLQKTVDGLQKVTVDLASQISTASVERVIIMVDRSNLDQTWRRIEWGALRPDYVKLKSFLVGGRICKQQRLYYSDIARDRLSDQELADWQRRQEFYAFLRHNGWILRGVLKKVYEGIPHEKGLDGALIRDMEMICSDGRCDTIVLVAGDADYCDVVEDVQVRYCVNVEVAFFPAQTSRDLQVRATKFINLECAKDRISRTPY